jgi:putative membrane protein insertion efficiency factor
MEVERRRRRVLIGLALFCGLFLLDQLRAPQNQLSARFLLGGIHLYQATLSPRMPLLGVHCRFKPTCSHYGEGAIRKYGAMVGTARTVWRVLRCGPWTPNGTFDPP